jgi:hypothetical protein
MGGRGGINIDIDDLLILCMNVSIIALNNAATAMHALLSHARPYRRGFAFRVCSQHHKVEKGIFLKQRENFFRIAVNVDLRTVIV